MEVKPTADMALKYTGPHRGHQVRALHTAPIWTPQREGRECRKDGRIPVMVDFGGNVRAGARSTICLNKYFRPVDIFTTCNGGRRGEQDPENKWAQQSHGRRPQARRNLRR